MLPRTLFWSAVTLTLTALSSGASGLRIDLDYNGPGNVDDLEHNLDHSLDKRAGSVIIGYRSVAAAEAEAYYKAGNTLTYQASQYVHQLGAGSYLSPVLGDWPVGDWRCAVLADSAAWNQANKAWLPATDDGGCEPLWWKPGEPNRDKYLQELGGKGFVSSNTILLSKIDKINDNKLQVAIPKALLGKKGPLGIHVQCAALSNQAGVDALGVYGDVDWYSWINVKGTPQRF